MNDAYIKHISVHLPKGVLSNEDIEKEFPEWGVEKVTNKLGIKQRHVSKANETASDLAEIAAQNLFEEYDINPKDIDFILLCTQSPDYFLPTTACILQHKLGIPTTAGALDFNLGCSGYVYGLSIAKGFISSGIAKNILFITTDTYTKYINHKDKSNRAIFGDGAAATIISTEGNFKIGDFVLGTDGSGAKDLMIKTGGSRYPMKEEKVTTDTNGYFYSPDNLYMNGANVFNFTLNAVPLLIDSILEKSSLNKSDIDYFVFHQANRFMLSTLRRVCGIEESKFYLDMENSGNTVSSTIPIALKSLLVNVNLNNDYSAKIILAGFGVGYSWGSCVIEVE